MWRIQAEQHDGLRHLAIEDFVRKMLAHLGQYAPKELAQLGEDGARELIALGLERARSHGLFAGWEVCIYIDLMLALGRDFDRDPRLPWAGEILNDEVPDERAKRLLVRAAAEQAKA